MPKRKALLVAAVGGHLEQISRLEKRFSPSFTEVDYATSESPQSRSLLADKVVHYVPYVPPRGFRESMGLAPKANHIVRHGGYTDVISTGSGIAVPFLLAARAAGMRAHYIESAARSEGPSLSGRIVHQIPGVHLYCQYPSWADSDWRFRGSVFDDYVSAPRPRPADGVHKVVVTLGTMMSYPFGRAVDAVQKVLAEVARPDVEVLWQVGGTPVGDRKIDAHALVPAQELVAAIREADLVFAHAGIGSCLQILDSGHVPVLFPRLAKHGEHIDNHQLMIATELTRRGLAVAKDPDDLDVAATATALASVVARKGDQYGFELDEGVSLLARHKLPPERASRRRLLHSQ